MKSKKNTRNCQSQKETTSVPALSGVEFEVMKENMKRIEQILFEMERVNVRLFQTLKAFAGFLGKEKELAKALKLVILAEKRKAMDILEKQICQLGRMRNSGKIIKEVDNSLRKHSESYENIVRMDSSEILGKLAKEHDGRSGYLQLCLATDMEDYLGLSSDKHDIEKFVDRMIAS